MKTMINVFATLAILVVMVGCGTKDKADNSTPEEGTTMVNGLPLNKAFEVVSVETGWRYASQPFVKVKIRNVSGEAVTKSVEVKYAFIKDDEIIDNSSHYIHGSHDIDWDNGLCVTAELKSITAFSGTTMNGIPKVKAKVQFIDGTPIWEGEVSRKVTAN